MSEIFRQRTSVAQKVQDLQKASETEFVAATDGLHAMLVRRADELEGCTQNSPAGAEVASISARHFPQRRALLLVGRDCGADVGRSLEEAPA